MCINSVYDKLCMQSISRLQGYHGEFIFTPEFFFMNALCFMRSLWTFETTSNGEKKQFEITDRQGNVVKQTCRVVET